MATSPAIVRLRDQGKLLLAILIALSAFSLATANPRQSSVRKPPQSWLYPSDSELTMAVNAGYANVKRLSPFRSIEVKNSPLTDKGRNVSVVADQPLNCAFRLGHINASGLEEKPGLSEVKTQCSGEITVLVVEETQDRDEHWRMKLEVEGYDPEAAEERDSYEPKIKRYRTTAGSQSFQLVGYEYVRIFSFYPEVAPSKALLRYTDGRTPVAIKLDFARFAEDELRARVLEPKQMESRHVSRN
jgi:hypothetical protein